MLHSVPPEPTRRERKRIQKMTAFLDLAMAIVEEEGLEGLTMPKLADRADVAVGGLYRYFSSKTALQCGLQVRAAQTFVAFLEPVSERLAHASPLDRVRAYALSWADFAKAEPIKHQMLDAGLSSPEVQFPESEFFSMEKALRPALERVAQGLKDAENEGLLVPGDVWKRTYAIWAAMHGVGHFTKRDRFLPESLHSNEIRVTLINSLFRGWSD